ncbi:MAG: hypothetical protein IMW99_00530 [Firmicutes bacterium]|nr:hypothetical protein [Bacillota bacterium]
MREGDDRLRTELAQAIREGDSIVRAEVAQGFQQMRQELREQMSSEMREGDDRLRTELAQAIREGDSIVRAEVAQGFQQMRQELREQMSSVRQGFSGILAHVDRRIGDLEHHMGLLIWPLDHALRFEVQERFRDLEQRVERLEKAVVPAPQAPAGPRAQ